MKRLSILLFTACLLLLGCRKPSQKDYLSESQTDKARRMAWWKEARFGMFIHWGLYAIPAGTYKGVKVPFLGEWIMNEANIPIKEYEKFAAKFNPTKFDADEWVGLAKRAGMKYIVITTKHHDGFCLWDSRVTNWDVMERTPFKRDILRELADACKKAGIRLGFYYSIMDWHHPDAQGLFHPTYNDKERSSPWFSHYVDYYMKPQLKELLTRYGDIGVLWFDGEWVADWSGDKGRELYNFVRGLKPDILVNNRVGRDREQVATADGMPKFNGDFGTPEQSIPYTGLPGVDWESCITMNNTWGYKSYDRDWKSTELLVRVLIDIVSKGGNLLLNVGPTSEGLIPSPSVERLNAIGDWMAVNGESIHGAEASPFGATRWGRYTRKGSKIYAHVFAWPVDKLLRMTKPNADIAKIYLLADKQQTSLPFQADTDGLVVAVPEKAPDPVASVVVIETEGSDDSGRATHRGTP